MVAKIGKGSSLHGALSYNQEKVKEEQAKVLFSNRVMLNQDGSVNMYLANQSFTPYMGANKNTVTLEKTIYNDLPYKFEAGTPDYIGSFALAKALSYIDNIGLDAINAYENELLWYAYEKLKDIDGVQIIGDVTNKSAIISFMLDGIHPHDAGILLNKYGIATRIGAHCCQPLMKELSIDGTIRASRSFYNTHQEIDRFVDSIEWIRKILLR